MVLDQLGKVKIKEQKKENKTKRLELFLTRMKH